MPAADADLRGESPSSALKPLTELPFPPVTKSHILNCSIHSWYPKYRSLTLRTRLIPLSPSFLAYLRADGIILPPEASPPPAVTACDNTSLSNDFDDDEDDSPDPSLDWPEVHTAIRTRISSLGGNVHPKLNWSAPKDATWIAANNSMECTTPNDVYLLLKSSDFITHDLQRAFEDCVDGEMLPAASNGASSSSNLGAGSAAHPDQSSIPYHLALRKTIPSFVNSMEFRCFVRRRRLLSICQRDLNHYDFMPALVPTLQRLINDFFVDKLRGTFPDENFVFDVYVPQPRERGRVWLIDVNPWAPRTDPGLWSWLELLTVEDPRAEGEGDEGLEDGVARLALSDRNAANDSVVHALADEDFNSDSEENDGIEVLPSLPEIRLVKRDDPENYTFNTPLYSAHKLPKDVVDASMEGGAGIRDFISRWESYKVQAESGLISDDDNDDN